MGTVYAIQNEINGKIYIGQTIRPFKKRLVAHLSSNSLIGRAIKKNGIEKFSISMNEVPEYFLDNFERNLIVVYKSLSPEGYNLETGGSKNKHISNESRQKMSKKRIGKKQSNETIKKRADAIKGEKHYLYGKKMSPEMKDKLSKAHEGKYRGKDSPHYGKHRSDETKKKLSDSIKGRHLPEEQRRKLSEFWKGRKYSIETRKRLSDSVRKSWVKRCLKFSAEVHL